MREIFHYTLHQVSRGLVESGYYLFWKCIVPNAPCMFVSEKKKKFIKETPYNQHQVTLFFCSFMTVVCLPPFSFPLFCKATLLAQTNCRSRIPARVAMHETNKTTSLSRSIKWDMLNCQWEFPFRGVLGIAAPSTRDLDPQPHHIHQLGDDLKSPFVAPWLHRSPVRSPDRWFDGPGISEIPECWEGWPAKNAGDRSRPWHSTVSAVYTDQERQFTDHLLLIPVLFIKDNWLWSLNQWQPVFHLQQYHSQIIHETWRKKFGCPCLRWFGDVSVADHTLFGHLIAGPLSMPESPKKKRMKDPWGLDFIRGTPGVALIRALHGQAE